MHYITVLGLIATPVCLLQPVMASVGCFSDGQPFDEQWTPKRIRNACNKMAGDFYPGQSKTQCVPMGDDRVSMSVHNKEGRHEHLHASDCRKGMHHIINECGGFGSDNHGGVSHGNIWKMV
jgi:hypothetical protein